MGGIVTHVEPRSLGARLKIRPGDELLTVNGRPVRDVIDLSFYAAEDTVEVTFRRGERIYCERARRPYHLPLGLEFEAPTFDGIRRCNNHCPFCFVTQMPPGFRRSLYIRDDDYRYSFLYGNFVTLTNLTEDDWVRIAEQHLSPLYISVHATDPALRAELLGNPHAPPILDQLRRLAELGIELHTQIVLVPGLNDGPHLERSLADLAELGDAISSVGIVPVGLTRYHRRGMRPYTPEEAGRLLAQVAPWQERAHRERGYTWVYPSDEWYLLADVPVPPAEAYDDFPQIENGIGLVRQFLDRLPAAPPPHPPTLTLVTGTLFAPLLKRVTASMPGVEVLPVVNQTFGPTVTVAGLLTARDVNAALERHPPADYLVLPRAMFDAEGARTLDDVSPDDFAARWGVPVILAEDLGDLGKEVSMQR